MKTIEIDPPERGTDEMIERYGPVKSIECPYCGASPTGMSVDGGWTVVAEIHQCPDCAEQFEVRYND